MTIRSLMGIVFTIGSFARRLLLLWEYRFILTIAFGMMTGFCLHEFSHWIIGKVAGSDPKPIWKEIRGRRVPCPVGIEHRSIDTVSNLTVRISGFVPFLWLIVFLLFLPAVISLVYSRLFNPAALGLFTLLIWTVAWTSFWAAVVMTESDLTALFDPEKFRERLKQDELSGEWGWKIIALKAIDRIR